MTLYFNVILQKRKRNVNEIICKSFAFQQASVYINSLYGVDIYITTLP